MTIAVVLVVLGGLALSTVRSASVHENPAKDAILAVHRLAAQAPMADYLRDPNNSLEGTVVDHEGRPMPGVEVLVYQRPGTASHAIEAVRATDASGAFRFDDLCLGLKMVAARAPGHISDRMSSVALVDGVGASAVDIRLEKRSPYHLRFVDSAGAAVVPSEISSFDPVEGEWTSVDRRADGDFLDPMARVRGEGITLRVGSPPAYFEVEAGSEEEPRVLPETPALNLMLEGAVLERLYRVILHDDEQRLVVDSEIHAEDGSLVVPGVPLGRYSVVGLGVEGGFARVHHHTGDPLYVDLVTRKQLGVVTAWASEDRPVAIRWRPLRAEGPALLELTASAPGDSVSIEPLDVGVIELVTEGHDTRWVPVDAWATTTGRTLRIQNQMSSPLSIRTNVGYLPIELVSRDGEITRGRTDAFGEHRLLATPGPYVVRATFHLGQRSLPRGVWAEAGSDVRAVHMTILDKPNPQLGSVFGFVSLDSEEPVPGARVFLQAGGAPRTATADEYGFFRFDGIPIGPYSVGTRALGADHCIPAASRIRLDQASESVRADLVLHRGWIDISVPGQSIEGLRG